MIYLQLFSKVEAIRVKILLSEWAICTEFCKAITTVAMADKAKSSTILPATKTDMPKSLLYECRDGAMFETISCSVYPSVIFIESQISGGSWRNITVSQFTGSPKKESAINLLAF